MQIGKLLQQSKSMTACSYTAVNHFNFLIFALTRNELLDPPCDIIEHDRIVFYHLIGILIILIEHFKGVIDHIL